MEALVAAEAPRWHGSPVTPEDAASALERAVEFKWDAFRAHKAVRQQAIAALTEQGLSVREVARVLGVSKSLVAKQLRERYFETPEYIRRAGEQDGRAARSRELIRRAWNGLWSPDHDPDYGTGEPGRYGDR
jgi:AraC-like DNA-binding protein